MTDQLPEIKLPLDVPIPESWARVVEQLKERAQVVEAWSDDMKLRATIAVRAHESTLVLLHQLLEQNRIEEAKQLAANAAEGIRGERGAHH